MEIINFEKKERTFLTKEQQESNKNVKICYICKEKCENTYEKYKKYPKVRNHCHYTGEYRDAAHNICNLKYSVPEKKFKFIMESNYDYYFIIKGLPEEFEKQINVSGENTEKYITFTVPIKQKLQELIKMEKELQRIYTKSILQLFF